MTCAAKVDEIASIVMGPETRAALHDGWNSAKNGIQGVAAYLSIVGEQPQPESKWNCNYTFWSMIPIHNISKIDSGELLFVFTS